MPEENLGQYSTQKVDMLELSYINYLPAFKWMHTYYMYLNALL